MTFAGQCREATDNYLVNHKEDIVSNIEQLCMESAQNGEERIFYAAPVNLEIIKILEDEGFTVVRRGHDYQDGITVSW